MREHELDPAVVALRFLILLPIANAGVFCAAVRWIQSLVGVGAVTVVQVKVRILEPVSAFCHAVTDPTVGVEVEPLAKARFEIALCGAPLVVAFGRYAKGRFLIA